MKRVITLATAFALASSAVFADEKSDRKAFREAYKAFKEAMAYGDVGEARDQARLAFEYGEKVYGPEHKNTATLLLNYARLIGNKKEAHDRTEDAVKRYERVYGKDAEQLIDPLIELASNSSGIGTLGDAKKHYRRALKLAEQHHPGDAFIEGQIRLEMGKIALQESQAREAIKYLDQAKTLFQTIDDPAIAEKIAETDFQIGKYKMAKKEFKEAEKALVSSLEVFEAIAPNARMTMTNHAFLIRAYEEQGLSDLATKHCRAIGSKASVNPDQNYLPIYRASPVYPAAALHTGKEGYAIVELTVDENGFVRDAVVVESKGHNAFRKASLDAAQKHRYAPRFENGEAVSTAGVRYKFSYGIR